MFKPLLVSALAGLLTASAHAADLDVDVLGLDGRDGSVLVAVYADAGTWLKKPVAVATQPVAAQQGGALRLHLKDVPDGTVAVTLFHDKNGNGRLDMNAMGMPQEPFGFSRDAAGRFGPPKFEQASFELSGATKAITIKLN